MNHCIAVIAADGAADDGDDRGRERTDLAGSQRRRAEMSGRASDKDHADFSVAATEKSA
jgi:hypothetical protein